MKKKAKHYCWSDFYYNFYEYIQLPGNLSLPYFWLIFLCHLSNVWKSPVSTKKVVICHKKDEIYHAKCSRRSKAKMKLLSELLE